MKQNKRERRKADRRKMQQIHRKKKTQPTKLMEEGRKEKEL